MKMCLSLNGIHSVSGRHGQIGGAGLARKKTYNGGVEFRRWSG